MSNLVGVMPLIDTDDIVTYELHLPEVTQQHKVLQGQGAQGQVRPGAQKFQQVRRLAKEGGVHAKMLASRLS